MQTFLSTHTQKSLQIDGITWQYYDSETDGPVILLLHGGFANFSMWIHQIIAFESHYQIIAPTCPVLPKATMQNYAITLANILDFENVLHTHLMGYSEGGLIAQYFLRA